MSLLVPTSLRRPGWIEEELGAWSYGSGNNRVTLVLPLRSTAKNLNPARARPAEDVKACKSSRRTTAFAFYTRFEGRPESAAFLFRQG